MVARDTAERDPPHVVVDAGALRLDVGFARTAHVFHVVDQLPCDA